MALRWIKNTVVGTSFLSLDVVKGDYGKLAGNINAKIRKYRNKTNTKPSDYPPVHGTYNMFCRIGEAHEPWTIMN